MSISAVYVIDEKGKVLEEYFAASFQSDEEEPPDDRAMLGPLISEETIQDNFVLVYELLDECTDFGYPQITLSGVLREYITQATPDAITRLGSILGLGIDLGIGQDTGATTRQVRVSAAVTGAVSWRPEGVKYRKNEVFIDVVESVNLLVNANGAIIKHEVSGSIQMRALLTGMPELKLGLNDKLLLSSTTGSVTKSFRGPRGGNNSAAGVPLEDVRMHQCVRLSRFEQDRTISFVPPDGDFELLSYRFDARHAKPPIWVEAVIEHYRHSRIEYMLKIKAQFSKKSTAHDVCVSVPVPPDADSARFKTTSGSCKYEPESSCFVWTLRTLQGGREHAMRAHLSLPSTERADSFQAKAPIGVKFELPYFTLSGLQVRYLKVHERSGYTALPWVRYITQAGDYQLRIG